MNKKIGLFVILIILIIGFLFYKQIVFTPTSEQKSPISEQIPVSADVPQLISTKPNPLDETYIPPTSAIELTFNMPIENIGEFKHRLEPGTTKYKATLSSDRKTAIITPEGSFPVGTTFTLYITPETKFDAGKRMSSDIIIHFKTIDYRGI